MAKIILKSQEQNVNYLKTGEVKSGYVIRPIRYSTIDSADIVESVAKNSYVPRAFVSAALIGITEAMENYLLNGHSIQLENFGTFSLSCEGSVAPTVETAGMEQFKALRLNFRPSTVLKAKIDAVDLEMDGVYKCLDLTADNKVYERIVQPESVTPDDNGNQGGSNQGGGDDLVG
jgi:predicted histone-like DNA-binding protein